MMDGDPRSILISMTLHALNLAKKEAAEKERAACEEAVTKVYQNPLPHDPWKWAARFVDAIALRNSKPPLGSAQ